MADSGSGVDWTHLPLDLLLHIVARLVHFPDYICFIAVCRKWRHAATEEEESQSINKIKLEILRTCRNKLPMLMVESANTQNKQVRDVYSFVDAYHIELPSDYYLRFVGSSLGWLLIIAGRTKSVILLNPFTRRRVYLPNCSDPRQYFEEEWEEELDCYFIKKGILSSDPLQDPEFEAVVIYGFERRLAFFTNRLPNEWLFIDSQFEFSDVVYFGGHIYAVTCQGQLFEVDYSNRSTRLVIEPTTSVNSCSVAYLVVSGEEGLLLMVRQFCREDDFKTRKFEVFVLKEGRMWFEMKNLGNQALFLGNNHSVCVSTLEFPMCQPNCIYYTSYYHSPYHRADELLIFDLHSEKIHPIHLLHQVPGMMKYAFPPIWIVPNLKEDYSSDDETGSTWYFWNLFRNWESRS